MTWGLTPRQAGNEAPGVTSAGVRLGGAAALACVCLRVLCLFPQELMTVGRIEKLFMSQRRWEGGEVGQRCLDHSDSRRIFQKQQFVLQFYLGFLKINPASRERHVTHAGLKIRVPASEEGKHLMLPLLVLA